MSLYPSLEDMGVAKMQEAQHSVAQAATSQAIAYHEATHQPAPHQPAPPAFGAAVATPPAYGAVSSSLYPSLEEYMGLNLTPEVIEANMPLVAANPPQNMQVATRTTNANQMQVAPITGDNIGLRRAEIKQGVREVRLCKDGDGKMGLRVRSVNKGVFVAFVHKDSPASLAGLRFGDQILQINGQNVAGWDTDKAMKFLKNCKPETITMAIRDRPFERTITMQKDSTGHIGFVFKDGKITALVKDSSAARNGVLTEHQLVEVNGQNVVGLKDKETGQIIDSCGTTVTITLIPTFIYDHIVRSMGSSLVKKFMDHSIPDA